MKFGNRIIAVIIMLFVVNNVQPAFSLDSGETMTMKQCIRRALDSSPVIKSYQYDYQIASKNVSLNKAVFFPSVGVGVGYDFLKEKSNKISNNTGFYSAQASLNQLIWDFGKSYANIKASDFNKIFAMYNFDNIVLNTILDVKTNYYTVLARRADVDIARSNVEINQRNYIRTKAFFDEGLKSKIDLVNAEVYLSDAKIALVKAEKAYKAAVISLNNSMYIAYDDKYKARNDGVMVNISNYTSDKTIKNISDKSAANKTKSKSSQNNDKYLTSTVEKNVISTKYKYEKFPYSFNECIKLATENRPDLKAYGASVDVMKQTLLAVKRDYYPTLSGNLGYGYKNTNNLNSFNVGVNLQSSVNIMAQKNQVDIAKYQVGKVQEDLSLLEQDIYFDIQGTYVSMIELAKQIPLLEIKIKQTKENLELAEGRYYVGLGSYIELQDAKVNYNNAQYGYVQAVFNYNVDKAKLECMIALQQEDTLKIGDRKL